MRMTQFAMNFGVVTFVLSLTSFTYVESKCIEITACMTKYGASFSHLDVDFANKTSSYAFLNAICESSNIETLIECYSIENLMGCSLLRNAVRRIPSPDTLRSQLTQACTQKAALIELSQCIIKPNVTKVIRQCSRKIYKSPGSDQSTTKEDTCWKLSGMMTCLETRLTGHCPHKTVEFLRKTNQEEYNAYCSASKLMFDLLFLYLFMFVVRVIL